MDGEEEAGVERQVNFRRRFTQMDGDQEIGRE
jgi:hypothetical protein